MSASIDQIKKLREVTGAGILDAKRALEEHEGEGAGGYSAVLPY